MNSSERMCCIFAMVRCKEDEELTEDHKAQLRCINLVLA